MVRDRFKYSSQTRFMFKLGQKEIIEVTTKKLEKYMVSKYINRYLNVSIYIKGSREYKIVKI